MGRLRLEQPAESVRGVRGEVEQRRREDAEEDHRGGETDSDEYELGIGERGAGCARALLPLVGLE